MDAAKSMGERLGTVTGLNRDKTAFVIRPDTGKAITLNNGDGLSFVGKDGDVEGVRADVCTGLSVKCKSTPALFEGAVIFRNFDMAFERELDSKACIRRISADITVSSGIRPAEDIPEPGKYDIQCATDIKNIPERILEVTATREDGRTVRKTYSGIWNDMASNIGRMESMIRTQLSKSSGIYSFTVKDIVHDGSLPLLSASVLNSIRNDIATMLDSRPVIPSEAPKASGTVILSVAKNLPLNNPETATSPHALSGKAVDYKANISNHLAEELYTASGCKVTEPAYELTHRAGAELMRTKYCIRHELGLCPKLRNRSGQADGRAAATDRAKSGTDAAPLYLLNNGRRFTVLFDCRSCEMVIK